MARMVRKQVYLDESHQRKLARIAGRWGCTESAVLRAVIDQLPESRDPVEACLAAARLLAPPLAESELSLGEASTEELERVVDALSEESDPSWGLAAAVVEDRR
jgi:hypothetical protein